MNKVILLGRLTKDPETRYSAGDKPTAVSRFSLAVDRKFKREGKQTVDFINCVSFGKVAELIGEHCIKGTKIAITGRINTDSYTNKDGVKIHTIDIIVEEFDFCSPKNQSNGQSNTVIPPSQAEGDGFFNIPDGVAETLPFN